MDFQFGREGTKTLSVKMKYGKSKKILFIKG